MRRAVVRHAADASLSARAVAMLGALQCVYWGVLYYSFAVMLVPMREEFGVSEATVAGVFSVALAVSASSAPAVGRRLDRGDGVVLLRWGGWCAAVLLWAWSQVHGVAALCVVWIGLGAAMAMVLYETAFALVTRATSDDDARLRGLASVTVLGGLASTLFLPIAGFGVAHVGWRTTLQGLLVVWLIATWMSERVLVPALRERTPAMPITKAVDPGDTDTRWVWRTAVPFVLATFAAMALTTVLIPALVDGGHRIDVAAAVLAGLGIMQLPGRIWLWRGGAVFSARVLLVAPLLLQATGLAVLAASPSRACAVAGVAVFGMGAGLHTLARPWLVARLFGVARAGRVNAAIARAQGMARAAGPFAAAAAYSHAGSRAVFGTLALALLLCCPLARALAVRSARFAG